MVLGLDTITRSKILLISQLSEIKLNAENRRVEVLRQQLRNNRNQNLRIQRLLNESQGERDLAILT